MTDDIHLRMKCLEFAIKSNTEGIMLFPGMEIHVLAKKYEHYVKTGEWLYKTESEREIEAARISQDEQGGQ